MLLKNTVKANDEIITGKIWRMDHPFFANLPFYTNILRMDEIEGSLQKGLGGIGEEG
jgi:hypothetical protein